MTIRMRMTLWYAGVLLLSVSLIGVLTLDELHERSERTRRPDRGMEEAIDIVLWIGGPAVLLSIGGGWWLMRKALAPVAALTQAAARLNERNLSDPLPRTGNGDELDRLTEVLNAMTARLDGSFQRIREFTLNASHELKTPLTVMRGELEIALQDASLPGAERERLLSQLDEVQRLAKIVDGLTLLTKADAGLVALQCEPVRLDELVREAFEDAQVLARPYRVKAALAGCDGVAVRGDRHRLRQLLLNLTDNAIKYNWPEGNVEMALLRREGMAVITLRNTGAGIPAAAMPKLFDRFFRGDPAHSHQVDGCGLGLSIAQWIVNAHGGSIQIHSVPAKETTVTVRLPLAVTAPQMTNL